MGLRAIDLRGLVAASIVVTPLVPAVVAIMPARAATETFTESFTGATRAAEDGAGIRAQEDEGYRGFYAEVARFLTGDGMWGFLVEE